MSDSVNNEDADDVFDDLEANKKKSRRKKVIFGALLVSLVFMGGGGGLFLGIGSEGMQSLIFGGKGTSELNTESDRPAPAANRSGGGAADAELNPDEIIVTDIENMTVNITSTDESGRTRNKYLRVGVSLVHKRMHEDAVFGRTVFMQDTFQDFLRQLDEAEIFGTAGRVMLKAELRRRANAVMGGESIIEDVLITNMVIQ